jgi:type I restriction enzyme S subunit
MAADLHSTLRIRDVLSPVMRRFAPEPDETYRLVGVRLYGEGCYVHTELEGRALKAPTLARLATGDIIYNKMWASKGAFAVVPGALDNAVVTTEFPVFRVRDGHHGAFLRHALASPRFWALAEAWSDGTTDRARLNPTDFLGMPLPSWDLNQQHQLAEVLDHATDAARLTEALVDQLTVQKRQMMARALERGLNASAAMRIQSDRWPMGRLRADVREVPAHWELVRLVSHTTNGRVESGHTPSRKHPEYWGGEVPWLSLADSAELKKLVVDRTVETITEEGLANSSARRLPIDTVVLSRTAVLAQCARLGREMATSQDFVGFVCGERLNPRYLVQLFRQMGREWERLKAGSSPTNKTLYFHVFEGMQILLPPMEEQLAIADLGDAFDNRIVAERAWLSRLRDMHRGLAQDLLTGRKTFPTGPRAANAQ